MVHERRQAQYGRDRFRPLVPLAISWLVSITMLAAVALQRSVPYADLVLDPNYSSGIPWYMGLVSNLGILGWTAAAVSALLGAWIAALGGRRGAASMLLGGAAITIVLLLDDLFQFHAAFKHVLGLPKATAYVFYAVGAGLWVLVQRHELQRTRASLLLAAAIAFGLSIVVDQGAPRLGFEGDAGLIVEDSTKFLGIVAWAQYFSLTTIDIVRSILLQLTARQAPTEPGNAPAVPVEERRRSAVRREPAKPPEASTPMPAWPERRSR